MGSGGCHTRRASPSPPSLNVVLELAIGTAFSWLQLTGTEVVASQVRRAVRDRPIPSPDEFAAYVRQRCRQPLADDVLSALQRVESRALRRRLHASGALTACRWRRLWSICCVLGEVWSGASYQSAAERHGTTEISVIRGCTKLCGSGWRWMVELDTWEAVVESALRRYAYVRATVLDPHRP